MPSSRKFSAIAVITLLAMTAMAEAKTLVTLQEALESAFPGCTFKTETYYLTPEQSKAVREKSGTRLVSDVIIRHVATCAKGGGFAYTDTHRVRTHPETLLISLDGSGKISRSEVLAFDEPIEYMPRGEWYGKFTGQALGPELALKRAIPPVTGASLTTRATTEAARRVLAIHEIVSAK